jgi:hypothetical protein
MSLPHSKNKSIAELLQRRDEEPDPNPDGRYWELGVQALRDQLADMIGKDNYREFAELVWPGETIDSLTWKQIYQQIDRALDEAWQGKRDLNVLADAALYPEQNVPGCYGL